MADAEPLLAVPGTNEMVFYSTVVVVVKLVSSLHGFSFGRDRVGSAIQGRCQLVRFLRGVCQKVGELADYSKRESATFQALPTRLFPESPLVFSRLSRSGRNSLALLLFPTFTHEFLAAYGRLFLFCKLKARLTARESAKAIDT